MWRAYCPSDLTTDGVLQQQRFTTSGCCRRNRRRAAVRRPQAPARYR
jgi:hypothetical protein